MCVGVGVAHADRETEDEARGGFTSSGTGVRPCCGGLRDTHACTHPYAQTHTHSHTVRHTLLLNAAYVTLRCKYCKTEEIL